jgi:hypothetical protein
MEMHIVSLDCKGDAVFQLGMQIKCDIGMMPGHTKIIPDQIDVSSISLSTPSIYFFDIHCHRTFMVCVATERCRPK